MRKPFELNATFKALESTQDSDKIFIEGLANSGKKDRVGDLIPASAWKQSTLDAYLKNNPILLFGHSSNEPIGQVTEASATEDGLFIKAWVYSTWDKAKMVKDGVLKTFSVHFNTDWSNWEYSSTMDAYVCKGIDDLFEISIVSIPADSNAVFSVAKSLGSDYQNFKKSHTKMSVIEQIKSLFGKAKSGDMTENEKAELKGLLNDAEILPIIKGMTEDVVEEVTEVVEEVVETEPTVEDTLKSLRAEMETLKTKNADLEAKVSKKNAKAVETEKTADPNPSGEPAKLSEREKAMEANAEALRTYRR